MKEKNCIIYINDNPIHNAGLYLLGEAFRSLGYYPNFIDLRLPDFGKELGEAVNEKTGFFLSIDLVGAELYDGDKSIYEHLNIPLVTLLLDTMDKYGMEICKLKNVYFGVYDIYDERYFKEFINPSSKYFHAKMCGYQAIKRNADDISKRVIDISFCGNIVSLNTIKQIINDKYSDRLLKVCELIIEKLLADETSIPYDVCTEIFGLYGITFADSHQIMCNMIRLAMLYVRSSRRIDILRTLSAAGLKVDCYGIEGQFKDLLEPTIVYHHFLNFYDNLAVMSNSKFVINTNSLTQFAITERQLSAMMNGAILLTDSNALNESLFETEIDMVSFKYKELDKLPERIFALLDNPDKMTEISQRARQKTLSCFTAMYRAKNIIDALESLK
ncbi:MAG: glycosyltransferase [Lachnospiraceae bacterium]|nr:glycosyltransferase [Lachnospiraceae bacterium]